jgi:hypothetical protein
VCLGFIRAWKYINLELKNLLALIKRYYLLILYSLILLFKRALVTNNNKMLFIFKDPVYILFNINIKGFKATYIIIIR